MKQFIEKAFDVKLDEMKMWDYEFLIRNLIVSGRNEINGVSVNEIIAYLKERKKEFDVDIISKEEFDKRAR